MPNYTVTVKAARVNANISRAEAAKHLGISLNSYGYRERGERRFFADELAKLGALFKVPYETFSEATCPTTDTQNICKGG